MIIEDGSGVPVGKVISNLQSLIVPRAGAKVLVAIVYSNNECWSDDAPYKNISYLCCKY